MEVIKEGVNKAGGYQKSMCHTDVGVLYTGCVCVLYVPEGLVSLCFN